MAAEMVATRPGALLRARARASGSELLAAVASIGTLTFLWWLATDGMGIVAPATIPSPIAVVDTASRLVTEPFAGETLPGHVLDSLVRWGTGVGAAIAIGIPLGLAMGWYRSVEALVSPAFAVLRNIPPLAWIPLAILWFGTGPGTQAGLVFVGAFPPCVLNAHRATRDVNTYQVWAARSVGASSLRQLVEVVVPAGLPVILAGIRIAFGNGWMAVVGAELIGAHSGLGFMIIRGQENMTPTIVVVGMTAIGLLGLVIDTLVVRLSVPLLRWRQEPADG